MGIAILNHRFNHEAKRCMQLVVMDHKDTSNQYFPAYISEKKSLYMLLTKREEHNLLLGKLVFTTLHAVKARSLYTRNSIHGLKTPKPICICSYLCSGLWVMSYSMDIWKSSHPFPPLPAWADGDTGNYQQCCSVLSTVLQSKSANF